MENITFYTVEHWQKNWDSMIERVEHGETIGIENDSGEKVIMLTEDSEYVKMYVDYNNEAS